jgi:tripartite-type tricarboxylate transporter receptor subunit TctC
MSTIARVLLGALTACSLVVCSFGEAAMAQTGHWPQRPVRFIVPAGTGTAIDFAARLYADKLSERWSKPVVIENRPGGDGITGVAAFAGANDDHTLLFAHSAPVAVQPVIQEKLPYDPLRDLVPISIASDIFIVIAAAEAVQATSIADFVARARAHSPAFNWAAGPGLPQYVFGAFLKKAGLDLTLVSYREVPPLLQDIGAGRIQVVAHSLAAVRPVLQSGKARLLATANSQRSSIAPDVPTAVEAGFADLRMDGFCGLYGRRGLSDELRERIARDVRAVAAETGVVARLESSGQAARASTPAEFAAALDALRRRIVTIAAESGLKATP